MKQSIEAIGPVRSVGASRASLLQTSPDGQAAFELRERFEAALSRAAPVTGPVPLAADDRSMAAVATLEMRTLPSAIEPPSEAWSDAVALEPPAALALHEGPVALRRPVIDDEVNDLLPAPAAPSLPMELMRVTSAVELPAAVGQVVPISATAAAQQRLQGAAAPDRSAPWHIAFGERDVTASGVSALVVTPSAQGPAQWRVVAAAGMQAVLSARVEGLRARLAERGVKGGVIAVSDQEGDDESQG